MICVNNSLSCGITTLGSSKYSRSDGSLWNGYLDGVEWPDNCSDLLQLGVVCPGPYLLSVWKHIYQTLTERRVWQKTSAKHPQRINSNARNQPPQSIGQKITLTTNNKDVFNELPIASSLKAPIEINHTTVLGFLVDAFEIEWSNIHRKNNFTQAQTRANMNAYLNKFWVGINGVSCYLQNINTNILVFNQMHHSWQKMMEIMISLPRVTQWCGNLNVLTNLIRMTGALHTCNSENRRQILQLLIQDLLRQGECLCFVFAHTKHINSFGYCTLYSSSCMG